MFLASLGDALKLLKIYRGDLVKVQQNGLILCCPGLFDGEAIVFVDESFNSIVIAMLATNPKIDIFSSIFYHLCQNSFKQYIGYNETNLCPTCLREWLSPESTKQDLHVYDVGTIKAEPGTQQYCSTKHHPVQYVAYREDNFSLAKVHRKECRAHNKVRHDIFINYRVKSEGVQMSSVEPSGGLVQMIYSQLAVRKTKAGLPIFSFLDKECLNFGQDWEHGFLRGLNTAKVIILLISNTTLRGIIENAPKQQDNVLVEYECALIRNRLEGIPVIPIFVGEYITENSRQRLVEFDFTNSFPSTEHRRGDAATRIMAKLSKKLSNQKKSLLGRIDKTMEAIFHLQGYILRRRGENQEEITMVLNNIIDVHHKMSYF